MTIRGILKLFTDPLSVPEMPRVAQLFGRVGVIPDVRCCVLMILE